MIKLFALKVIIFIQKINKTLIFLDAFVNSEEWTLSRAVQELKMGVVGLLNSAKTSFIHFFLTEQPTAEESPEGGRFKKEIVVDGRSYLLLIRDEGCNAPEFQVLFTWIYEYV